jgi:hypothetical protein
MKTITINHYEFPELTKEAQERAINGYYDMEDYPFLDQDLLEELKELDSLKLFSNQKLCFSLSHSQSDGLLFNADVDKLKLLEQFNFDDYTLRMLYENMEVSMYSNFNSFSPSKSDVWCECRVQEEDIKIKADEVISFLESYYMDICRKLLKYGYSIIDYRMSNEEFAEFSQSNGYMYLESGILVQ